VECSCISKDSIKSLFNSYLCYTKRTL